MSTGLIVFGLWIIFCAVLVVVILWVVDHMVEVVDDEECPLGKDCNFEKKVEENKDDYEHTKEYYDRDRNR